MYLGEGKRIRPDVWRMMQAEKPNIFLRELLVKLWERADLANRALQVEKVLKSIPNRSPVKLIEPNLLRLLISNNLFLFSVKNIITSLFIVY